MKFPHEARAEALETLRQIGADYDAEIGHANADAALCTLLEHLGYSDVVAAYRALSPKWYA